jgi:putative ABC transport system permease protein
MKKHVLLAVRRLVKSPVFALTAILGVAACIGINSAVFAVVNGLVLRPLPYEGSERLVLVTGQHPQIGRFSSSYPDFVDLKTRSNSFEYLAAFQQRGFTVITNEVPQKFRGLIVSADFFPMLGVTPALGRFYSSDEELGKGGPVVVLSHGLWRDEFNADPKVIGKSVTINSVSYTIIGVTPQDFRPPVGGRFWLPLQVSSEARDDRGTRFLRILGKLKPGVTIEQAQTDLSLVASQLEQQYPNTNASRGALVIPLQSELTKTDRLPLLLTLGAVVFILLITCLNLANLFMARALARAKEIGICMALGLGRMYVVKQFLTESMLLALTGGALGLFFSFWMRDILVASLEVSTLFRTDLDFRILLFTTGIILLTGIISGLIPALRISSIDPLHTLKEGGSSGSTPGRRTLLKGLVSAEVGLALALTIGAMLMYKSLLMMQHVNLGFNSDDLIVMTLSLPEKKYDTEDKQASFYTEVREAVKSLPGAGEATLTSLAPLSPSVQASKILIEGRPPASGQQLDRANYHVVSDEYFSTMNVPLLSGRVFTSEDRKGSEPVAIIGEKMAKRFWPNEDPLNRRFKTDDSEDPWLTIVGVVADVKYVGLIRDSEPEYYVPFLQNPQPDMEVLMRGADTSSLMKQMREKVFAIDKYQPVDKIGTMSDTIDEQLGKTRSLAKVIGLFGVTALLLAAAGIYGITSHSVKLRTREVGVRMALGARSINVLTLIVRQSLKYVLTGIVAGLVAGFFLSRAISSLLFGVQSLELKTYVLAALLLILTGIAASYIPARRATRISPASALRDE